jgi:hypothetical protein
VSVSSSDPGSPIGQELASGERLIWCGQPRSGIRFRGVDAILIPFSIVWCGFAIFWEIMASTAAVVSKGGPGNVAAAFPLFGVPFVLIGLYFVFGRFIWDARLRARTFYGVTSDRIIIVTDFFGRRIKSLTLRTMSEVSLNERSDGSGTITFGPTHPYARWATSWPGASQFASPAFELIDRAKEIYELIRRAQKTAT